MSTSHPSQNHTPWDELTPARQRLAKTIAHVHGPETFERPVLKEDVEDSSDLGDVIDSKDRVLKSLKSTSMLNDLEDDGYLENEYQGGENPIVLDLEYDENRDRKEVAPYGNPSALSTIVFQILDRESLSEGRLGDVDMTNFNAVIEAVNRAVGRTVLVTVSESSEYSYANGTYDVVTEAIEEDSENDEDEEG